MKHSLVQEMTMVTEYTTLESAEEVLSHLKDLVRDEGKDPYEILEELGIQTRLGYIQELTGEDELLDLEQDSDLEYD